MGMPGVLIWCGLLAFPGLMALAAFLDKPDARAYSASVTGGDNTDPGLIGITEPDHGKLFDIDYGKLGDDY